MSVCCSQAHFALVHFPFQSLSLLCCYSDKMWPTVNLYYFSSILLHDLSGSCSPLLLHAFRSISSTPLNTVWLCRRHFASFFSVRGFFSLFHSLSFSSPQSVQIPLVQRALDRRCSVFLSHELLLSVAKVHQAKNNCTK